MVEAVCDANAASAEFEGSIIGLWASRFQLAWGERCETVGDERKRPGNPFGIQFYERWAPFYDRTMMLVRWHSVYESALQDLEPPCRLLDVACGTGTLVRMARQRGLDAIGLDCCQGMLAAAKGRFGDHGPNGHFTNSSAYVLPFADGVFDTVVSTGAISGMDDAPQAIREMVRVTRAGGVVRIIDYWSPKDPNLHERAFVSVVKRFRRTFHPVESLFDEMELESKQVSVAFFGCVRMAEAAIPPPECSVAAK